MSKIYSRLICGLSSRKSAHRLTGESGLALPIVLAVLALGALVTGPFLAHASAAANGSAIYGQMINENYSAEAGLEHGLWNLTQGNLAAQIPNVGNSVSYALPNPVNKLVPNITVTTLSIQGPANPAGTIIKPFIDSFQFDTAGYTPAALSVATGICALAYRDSANRLILKTVAIAANGAITHSIIDSLTLASTGYEPDLVSIASGVFGIVYRGSSNKDYIATVQISAGGVINHTVISQVSYSSTSYEPRIVFTSGNYYLVAYRGSSNKGYAATLQITNTGIVTNVAVSSYSFASTCYEPDIVLVSGNYYAVTYRGASNKGNLATISVNGSGIIANQTISSLIFNASAAYTPRVVDVAGTTFALAYRGPSNYGYLTTVTISAAGIISSPIIDSLTFDSSLGYEPGLIQIASGVYAVAYRRTSNHGSLRTVGIAAGGSINHTFIDSYEFDTANGYEPGVLLVSGNIYVIFYRGGTGTTGYLKTIQIANSTGSTGGTYQIQSSAGGTTTTAIVAINTGLSKVTSWIIDR